MRGSDVPSAAEAESLLQWWSDAGVDCLVDEAPRDWLRPKPGPIRTAPPVREEPASLPGQLDLFHGFLATSESLPFAADGAPRVCPSGDPGSGLMMLSDMPSAEDCAAGGLISGEAGRLFDRMLAAIGRDRGSIYLASLSCLRSASGSFPGGSAAQCVELAQHHVALASPKALLVLGDAASRALFGGAVMQTRGRWHSLSTPAGEVATLVSFHPSFLLERPTAKPHAWADLQMLSERLES